MAEVLEDGSYAFGDALDGSCLVELTILAGPHKGEVVTVRGAGVGQDPIDLLGIPATITVSEGAPRVRFEP